VPATETNKGKLGSVLKSRHSILGTHAQTSLDSKASEARPLVSAWIIKSLRLFELKDGLQKKWRCLTRTFA